MLVVFKNDPASRRETVKTAAEYVTDGNRWR